MKVIGGDERLKEIGRDPHRESIIEQYMTRYKLSRDAAEELLRSIDLMNEAFTNIINGSQPTPFTDSSKIFAELKTIASQYPNITFVTHAKVRQYKEHANWLFGPICNFDFTDGFPALTIKSLKKR